MSSLLRLLTDLGLADEFQWSVCLVTCTPGKLYCRFCFVCYESCSWILL